MKLRWKITVGVPTAQRMVLTCLSRSRSEFFGLIV